MIDFIITISLISIPFVVYKESINATCPKSQKPDT